jgi:large conductance mechanosensitive channel
MRMAKHSSGKARDDEPKPRRVIVQAGHATLLEIPELKVPRQLQGFTNFIREQGVVGLSVGFVVGTSASVVVKSIVTNIFDPLISLITGGEQLSTRSICLQSSGNTCTDALNYGQVISDLVTFMLILFMVYLLIKSLKLDKIDKKKK